MRVKGGATNRANCVDFLESVNIDGAVDFRLVITSTSHCLGMILINTGVARQLLHKYPVSYITLHSWHRRHAQNALSCRI